ncbi:MAG: tRNA adenosine(34) deaminase TadA [Lachnospiraceae bacterium]|nr:tRNA adenosine(34) deaminase TadA [Lachnospiraceae bacterium]
MRSKRARRQARRERKEAEAIEAAALQLKTDEKYMKQAIKQAKKAAELGEVPIGCVIVYEGKIIGRGYNRRNTDKSTFSHAEISAMKKAGKVIGDWRLEGCTMYVTLEPCQMCAGAIVQARIPRVVMGCMNPKAGCAGSVVNILQMKEFNHQVDVTRDILKEECSRVLKDFFAGLRSRDKEGRRGK